MVNMDEWRPRPFPPNTTARRRALRAPDAAVRGTLCAWAMQDEIVKNNKSCPRSYLSSFPLLSDIVIPSESVQPFFSQ